MERQTGTFNPHWRQELPTLTGRLATLRESAAHDAGAVVELLSLSDATRFGLNGAVTALTVQQLLERAQRERAAGQSFTYSILARTGETPVGLIQTRRLDPAFDVAEWECTLVPSARSSGVFLEAARLAGSFAFGVVGVRRLEARVLLQNGRGNTALRKLGAVQEGILRRSIQLHGEYVDQVLWSILKDDWGELWMPVASQVH